MHLILQHSLHVSTFLLVQNQWTKVKKNVLQVFVRSVNFLFQVRTKPLYFCDFSTKDLVKCPWVGN